MSNILLPTEAVCSMCQKKFEKEPILVPDWDLCPECRKTYGGMVYVICIKCNALVSRMKPGEAFGKFFKPFDKIHVRECPYCNPSVQVSIPIEAEGYEES